MHYGIIYACTSIVYIHQQSCMFVHFTMCIFIVHCTPRLNTQIVHVLYRLPVQFTCTLYSVYYCFSSVHVHKVNLFKYCTVFTIVHIQNVQWNMYIVQCTCTIYIVQLYITWPNINIPFQTVLTILVTNTETLPSSDNAHLCFAHTYSMYTYNLARQDRPVYVSMKRHFLVAKNFKFR